MKIHDVNNLMIKSNAKCIKHPSFRLYANSCKRPSIMDTTRSLNQNISYRIIKNRMQIKKDYYITNLFAKVYQQRKSELFKHIWPEQKCKRDSKLLKNSRQNIGMLFSRRIGIGSENITPKYYTTNKEKSMQVLIKKCKKNILPIKQWNFARNRAEIICRVNMKAFTIKNNKENSVDLCRKNNITKPITVLNRTDYNHSILLESEKEEYGDFTTAVFNQLYK